MPSRVPQPTDPLALFAISPSSAVAPFMQVHETVVAAIADGRLVPGQRLPTVRALASHLGIAVNTAAAAYRSLEQAGVIEGRGRAGSFVRLGDDPIEARAREVLRDAVAALRQIGITEDRARRLLAETYAASARP